MMAAIPQADFTPLAFILVSCVILWLIYLIFYDN